MATTTKRPAPKTIPGFRRPWEGGAKAYPEADTFAAAKEGFKRKRNGVIFHMPNTGEAGRRKCALCGGTLSKPALKVSKDVGDGVRVEASAADSPDRCSTWRYDPKTKKVFGGMHYLCSWSDLFGQISRLSRRI